MTVPGVKTTRLDLREAPKGLHLQSFGKPPYRLEVSVQPGVRNGVELLRAELLNEGLDLCAALYTFTHEHAINARSEPRIGP
jgi:hypothetical protein